MLLRPMRKHAVAGLGTALLAAGLTLVAPSAHAAMVPTPDDAAASWLTRQLGSDDLVGGDLATTIDFGIALAKAGGPQATLDRIQAKVDAGVATYSDTDAVSAAQAAVYYQTIGVDPATKGGDLIAKVQTATNDTTGEMTESFGGGWSQGLAVRALQTAGSSEAAKATDFLVSMACAGGGWGDTTCSFGADPDDTADALFALIPLTGKGFTSVDDAVTAGIAWLKANQQANGSFNNFGDNTSSTGLAAQALALQGDTAEATKAARWLRARQVAGTPCDGKLSTDGGAVAYSDNVLATGRTDGIAADAGAKYDWYEATVQAYPVLGYAPENPVGHSVSAPGWAKAGSTVTATGNGLAPNERACLTLAGKNVDLLGGTAKTGSFKLGATTRSYSAVLRVLGAAFTTKVVALAPKTLPVSVSRPTIAKGGTERIVVKGLYPGERVRITYHGVVVASGSATTEGWFGAGFAVGRKAGSTTVYAVGRFSTRAGHATFTVR